MEDYITTYTKRHVTPLDPKPEQIDIRDIAHALSYLSRANGHFPEFYSVAQHSIQCCREAEARGYSRKLVLACLLHDGSEAYLSDITRPVKRNLPGYRQAERRLQAVIYETFLGEDLTEDEAEFVKRVDDDCLYYEFEHYMGERLQNAAPEMRSDARFLAKGFAEVEKEFLGLADHFKIKKTHLIQK